MNKRRRLAVLTNIPTPYRIYFFEELAQELRRHSWGLDVHFMAMREPGRYWQFAPETWDFSYRQGRGLSFPVNSATIHFQPDLVAALASDPPECILMSGGWFHPTNQFVLWLLRRRQGAKIFFWSESNLAWVRFDSGWIGKWRSVTYRAFDGYVVPGQMALDYVTRFADTEGKPTIYLPNLIDETIYGETVDNLRRRGSEIRAELELPADRRILLAVCRLTPIKGVMELLDTVLKLPERDSLFLALAGEGQQRSEIEAFIAENGLSGVRLLGHLNAETIVRFYAAVDAFILPSLGDPYPLAVIEACFAGLPLLLSKHVGCHPEALVPGKNGWLFNPEDPQDIMYALQSFMAADSGQLKRMGAVSAAIANENFHTKTVLPRFVSELLACT